MADRHPQRRRPPGRRGRRGGECGGDGGDGVGRLSADALHSSPARDSEPGPVRTCVGCRRREQATGLLRVVVVDGTLVPDPRRRLPGRGASVHPRPECLDRAERRSAFPRALRVPGPLDTAAVRKHLEQQEGVEIVSAPSFTEDKVDPS
ncbi:YlxR family protein [Pseudonocardia sp. WMMC193]|uniref:YlxR family protein n=1 Tax=Pseudonocardia sp. WMMC193 TaxID=2911965 RepID=UPI0027E118B1|nr:YlxR family protein [Pseudonocardia sp. WMMC193]